MRKITLARYYGIGAALAATLVVGIGCIFGPPGPGTGEQGPKDPTEPAYVLDNIALSYNQHNINLYKQSLSPNYVFYFNPNDVGTVVEGYEIPVSWNYPDDWNATKKMFEEAYSISLTIPTGTVGTPGPNYNVWNADNITPNLLLYVTPDNGYIVNAGYCNFEFEKYQTNEGKSWWRLRKWWDYTSAAG